MLKPVSIEGFVLMKKAINQNGNNAMAMTCLK